MNTILSIRTLTTTLQQEVAGTTLPAAPVADRIDQLVALLQENLETVGGSLEFRLKTRKPSSKEEMSTEELFAEYADIRRTKMDTLRAAAEELEVDISEYGGKRKEIYEYLCDVRREKGMSAPLAPLSKNTRIAPNFDLRSIPEALFFRLLDRAEIPAAQFGKKKSAMIIALAQKYNKAPEEIAAALQQSHLKSREAAQAATQAAAAASKQAGVTEVSVETVVVTEAGPVEEISVVSVETQEDVAETVAVEAAPAEVEEIVEAAPAEVEITEITVSTSDSEEVETVSDNPFLQGKGTASSSLDLDDLLS